MSGKYFPHAHTRPEFLDGVLRALNECASDDLIEMAVGERCGITVPTRMAFKEAGYYPVFKRNGVKHYHFEEVPQVEIPMYHADRMRDSMFFPEPIAQTDFFVNVPKFKAHPWTTVTFSMKNYIGIQDDRHRLIDHDHKLNQKVVDLQYAIQPQFIVIDAITAGEGRMLTPLPFDLGLIIMGDNQVAFDAVCCHIIGIDPLSVDHIRFAYERGFGPVSLDEINVVGSVSLAEAKKRAAGFRVGLIRVEDYFKDTNIKAYAGPPPKGGGSYCWGGCPGAMIEAIEILRVMQADANNKIPNIHIVFGDYDGPINAKSGEKVVFIGDCTSWKGTINGEKIEINSIYQDRSTLDPHNAKHEDIFKKMYRVVTTMFRHRKSPAVRVTGCPVSVAEQVLTLVSLSDLKNPYFQLDQLVPFSNAYLSSKAKTALNRIQRKPYQIAGPTHRGQARPEQNQPPDDLVPTLEMFDQSPQVDSGVKPGV